ncbi:carboxypeptidase-like regulatory domain-containing protein [Cecembia lonarensis]|uniref:Carboxypeptidase regulatory-like domain-containing protein n=1 Tax=Cecembia lonarensis (strain CCUG 58316 / KCTC 22772 / LW9) TaxID=1225176 RepID=K1LLF4_CECL9|nr:carboxypeptidase-like regulatory domain-containing protein [Cecembia lonarensis]EKB51198.1 hypothetical protein B879_00249 [Cecembia lonarensis LW9]
MYCKNLMVVSLVFLIFSACIEKENNSNLITKADIVGSVILYDEGTNQLEKSGMLVRIQGTSSMFSTLTDVTGKFVIKDVPFGEYNIEFEKEEFGTFKIFALTHTNSGKPTSINQSPSLGKKSSTEITALSVGVEGDNVIVSITTNPAGNNSNRRYLRYFLGEDANLSQNLYSFYSSGYVVQFNPYTITISKSDLAKAGFVSGKQVYIRAYGDSFWGNEYLDPTLNRKIFPNLNPNSAAAVSFTVP